MYKQKIMIELKKSKTTSEEMPPDLSKQDALSRFVDDSYTLEDMALLLNEFNKDDDFQAFHPVYDRIWNEVISNPMPKSKEQQEANHNEAAQLIEEYERKHYFRTPHVPVRNSNRFRKIWYAAAVMLMVMLVPASFLLIQQKRGQTHVVAQNLEVVTQRGEIKTVTLPDQTGVTLNAKSRLTYPATFSDRERSVQLEGEAIFDVTSDNERPFTVTTTDMKVKVMGTVFDVKAYQDDDFSMVSVASGKVEVDLADKNVLLETNHQLKWDKTTQNVEKMTIDANKYLMWSKGTLYFNRTPLVDVVNVLNRYYPEMEIELAEGEYFNLISGVHDNKQLEDVVQSIINITGLKCKKTANKIIIYAD